MLDLENLKKDTRLNGRYIVRGRIGEGWEGVTYQVRDRLDSRLKALKFITNSQRKRSILNQASVLVRLQHPNVIDYYTVDTLRLGGEDAYFLLLEYLQGPRLSDIVAKYRRQRRQPPLFYMLRIFYQIASGMAYCHDQHMLHDDLHTDNVILTGDIQAPVPKVFDFWGSRGAKIRQRRAFDLKCAGQILFECLTGVEEYKASLLKGLPEEVAVIIRHTQARVHTYSHFHQMLADLDDLRAWE